jgi:hypothetical protein
MGRVLQTALTVDIELEVRTHARQRRDLVTVKWVMPLNEWRDREAYP